MRKFSSSESSHSILNVESKELYKLIERCKKKSIKLTSDCKLQVKSGAKYNSCILNSLKRPEMQRFVCWCVFPHSPQFLFLLTPSFIQLYNSSPTSWSWLNYILNLTDRKEGWIKSKFLFIKFLLKLNLGIYFGATGSKGSFDFFVFMVYG